MTISTIRAWTSLDNVCHHLSEHHLLPHRVQVWVCDNYDHWLEYGWRKR